MLKKEYPKVLDERYEIWGEKEPRQQWFVLIDWGEGKEPSWSPVGMGCTPDSKHSCRRGETSNLPPLALDACGCGWRNEPPLKTNYGKERDLVRDIETNADETYLTEALYKELAGGGEYKSHH